MTWIYIAVDGLVTTHSIDYAPVDGHTHWCNVVRDALIEKRWEDVYRMLEKHDDDELTIPPETSSYTIGICKVASEKIAHKIIVRFCKMGIGDHPLLNAKERWYFIPNFEATSEDLWRVSQLFTEFVGAM